MEATGFGVTLSDIQPQLDWLAKAWPLLDANGRDWETALFQAKARAVREDWPEGSAVARSDLIALALHSFVTSKIVASQSDDGKQAAAVVLDTWAWLAQKVGYVPGMTVEQQRGMAMAAELPLLQLILVIAAGLGVTLIVAGLIAFVVVNAAKIIDRQLSRNAAERQVVHATEDAQKVVDRHVENPGLPWTQEERDTVERAWKLREGFVEKAEPTPAPPPRVPFGEEEKPFPWGLALGITAIAAGTVLAVAYREEIKRLLAPRPRPAVAAERYRRRRRLAA